MTTHAGPALFRFSRSQASLLAWAFFAACSDPSPATTSPDPTLTTPAPPTNILPGASFWVDPVSNARATATAWRTTRPADAAQMDKIASQGVAKWFGSWNANIVADVSAAVTTMRADGSIPVLVAFNLPQLGCGGFTGSTSAQAYRGWIAGFGSGLGGRRAVVILEPDALGELDCLSAADQQVRLELLRFAVQTLTASGNVAVYIDAGHPRWHSAQTMSQRLLGAGVAKAEGFSLNVANFFTTAENLAFGAQLAGLVGGKHFVIDTGRNGLGPSADGQWCNPPGRAIGDRPSSLTGVPLVDGYLWVKAPGESDGACNGGPASGTWMPEYALGLAQRG